MFGGLGVGAGQHKEVVCVVGAAGPYLLPGDHEIVAVLHGSGLQRRQVGARARFAETLAPVGLAPGYLAQVPALLLLGAVHHERGPQHADAERVLAGGSVVGHLLVEDELGDGRGVLATVLLGPTEGKPTAVGKLATHGAFELRVLLRRLDKAVAPPWGQLGSQEIPKLLPKDLFLWSECKLHGDILYRGRLSRMSTAPAPPHRVNPRPLYGKPAHGQVPGYSRDSGWHGDRRKPPEGAALVGPPGCRLGPVRVERLQP